MTLNKFMFKVGMIFFSISFSANVQSDLTIPTNGEIDVSSKIANASFPVEVATYKGASDSIVVHSNNDKYRDAYIKRESSWINKGKVGKGVIWQFPDNDSFGFTLYIQPKSDGKNMKPAGYINKVGNKGYYYYNYDDPYNVNVDESFKFKKVGGEFTVKIYALKNPNKGEYTIPKLKIATLETFAADFSGETKSSNIFLGNLEIIVKPKTCQITNKSITIEMKKVLLTDFKNKQEIYGGENSFIIICEEGFDRKLSATISDANNGNSADYLKSNGSASGFGVRLYDNDSKQVKFSPGTTGENKITLKNENNVYSIPLKAYYFKKDADASVGTIKSLAQVTLRYE